MATPKEIEPKPPVPEGVVERPTEVPPEVERAGASVIQTQFTQQVTDQGKPLIQTPQTKTVTIQIPADQGQLTGWSKGSIVSSLTWMAAFWIRMIKKALHFGWKVIGRGNAQQKTHSK